MVSPESIQGRVGSSAPTPIAPEPNGQNSTVPNPTSSWAQLAKKAHHKHLSGSGVGVAGDNGEGSRLNGSQQANGNSEARNTSGPDSNGKANATATALAPSRLDPEVMPQRFDSAVALDASAATSATSGQHGVRSGKSGKDMGKTPPAETGESARGTPDKPDWRRPGDIPNSADKVNPKTDTADSADPQDPALSTKPSPSSSPLPPLSDSASSKPSPPRPTSSPSPSVNVWKARMEQKQFLKSGDDVAATVEAIGELRDETQAVVLAESFPDLGAVAATAQTKLPDESRRVPATSSPAAKSVLPTPETPPLPSSGKRKQWKPLEVEIKYNTPLPPKGPRKDNSVSGTGATPYGDRRGRRADDDRHTPRRATEKPSAETDATGSIPSVSSPLQRDPIKSEPQKPVKETSGLSGEGAAETVTAVTPGKPVPGTNLTGLETPPRAGGADPGASPRRDSPDGSERRTGGGAYPSYRSYGHGAFSPGYRADRDRSGPYSFGARDNTSPRYNPGRRPAVQSPVPGADAGGAAKSAAGAEDDKQVQGRFRRSHSSSLGSVADQQTGAGSGSGFSHQTSLPNSPNYRRSPRYPGQSQSWRQNFAHSSYYTPYFAYGGTFGVPAGAADHTTAGYQAATGSAGTGSYLSLYTGPGGHSVGVPASPTAAAAFAIPDPSQYQSAHLTAPMIQMYIRAQVEWYFSTDNLCKDMFLRRHMDAAGGWVDSSIICGFRRVSGWIDHLRAVAPPADADANRDAWTARQVALALHDSHHVELEMVAGVEQTLLRLRKRDAWELWVLPRAVDLSGRACGVHQHQPINSGQAASGTEAEREKAVITSPVDASAPESGTGVRITPSDTAETTPLVTPPNAALAPESADNNVGAASKEGSLDATVADLPDATSPTTSDVVVPDTDAQITVIPVGDGLPATLERMDDEERSSNQTAEPVDEEVATHDEAGEPTLVGDAGSAASVSGSDELIGLHRDAESLGVSDAVASEASAPASADTGKGEALADEVGRISWSDHVAETRAARDVVASADPTLKSQEPAPPSSKSAVADGWVTVTAGRRGKKGSSGSSQRTEKAAWKRSGTRGTNGTSAVN